MTGLTTAIILQGGGALGAYQAGVFEQLAEDTHCPDWVIGTSIGAINGAIIAGNKPEHRVPQLRSFWQSLAPQASWLDAMLPAAWTETLNPLSPYFATASKTSEALAAMMRGVNGFFQPRFGASLDLNAKVGIEQAGFYDTTPLRQTLLDHVDFAYLNAGSIRLSVCAVDVETAELTVFDSARQTLRPEHIMASGALPPAFPPVIIDGRAYWDGGIYSNTPLEVLLAEASERDALVFMIDLWDPTEALPTTMAEVLNRAKDIQFAGRATAQIAQQAKIETLQRTIRDLSALVPEPSMEDGEVATLALQGRDRTVSVVRMVLKATATDNQFKDIDFSADAVKARWSAGMADAARALKHKSWLKPLPPHAGLVIHELDQR